MKAPCLVSQNDMVFYNGYWWEVCGVTKAEDGWPTPYAAFNVYRLHRYEGNIPTIIFTVDEDIRDCEKLRLDKHSAAGEKYPFYKREIDASENYYASVRKCTALLKENGYWDTETTE